MTLKYKYLTFLLFLSIGFTLSLKGNAQSYDSLWLRYNKISAGVLASYQSAIPKAQLLSVSGVYKPAIKHEFTKGLSGLLGKDIKIESVGDLAITPIQKGLILLATQIIIFTQRKKPMKFFYCILILVPLLFQCSSPSESIEISI